MPDIFDQLQPETNIQAKGDIFDQISPDKMVGLFGKVPETQYQQGERNIVGNIFERPAAAIRGGIYNIGKPGGFGKGYREASINPANAPRIQEVLLDKYYDTDMLKNHPVIKWGIGNIVSAGGMALDIASDPTTALTVALPGTPGVKQLLGVVAKTKPAQMIASTAGKPLSKIFAKTDTQILADIEKEFANTVKSGIQKGIRPTVAGKQTIGRTTDYFDKVGNGVKTILYNKNNLKFMDEAGNTVNRLPESVVDYAQAINQTKKRIYDEYSTLAQEAGDMGAQYNPDRLISSLKQFASGKGKNLIKTPETRQYAESLISQIEELRGATPDIIEGRIAEYNKSLSGYYAGRVAKSQAEVDVSVANMMRSELDTMIEKATGKQYQPLKNAYGALKAVEKEVNHRAVVAMRQAPKNVFDLTDIFSGGEIVHGLLTANPAEIAKGTAMSGIKNYFKKINSPDYIIKRMFKNADKLISKADEISLSTVAENLPTITPEVVSKLPISEQKALADFSNVVKQVEFKPRGLPSPETKYGEGFTARKPKFVDYIRWKKSNGIGKEFLEEKWKKLANPD